MPIWWTTHYSLLKTCKYILIGGLYGCMTRQCSGRNWTRDLQSQV